MAEIQAAAVRNKDGQVELFTVGTDNAVWNFSPDPTSDTGYRQERIGLTGSVIAAGLGPGGSIVVLAGRGWAGAAVNYMVKKTAFGHP